MISRTNIRITDYLLTIFLLMLFASALARWLRERDSRAGHLAWASGVFAAHMVILSVSIQWFAVKPLPSAVTNFSNSLMYVVCFLFFLFLTDFIGYGKIILPVIGAGSAFMIYLVFVERVDVMPSVVNGNLVLAPIPGVHNLIGYLTFADWVFYSLAIMFGLLMVAFAFYGLGQRGLARSRMLLIAAGFLLLCAALGFAPLMGLHWKNAGTLVTALSYLALASSPLLWLGFATPKPVAKLLGRRAIGSGSGRAAA